MVFWEMLCELTKIHGSFARDTYELNKYGASFITIFPSVIFLITNFVIIYKFCHRYTRIGYTSFRAWFFRELTFHWSYFYLSKLWFMFMRMYKLTAGYVCQGLVIIILLLIDQSIFPKRTLFQRMRSICGFGFSFKAIKDPAMDLKRCHLTGLLILSIVSMIPILIYVVRRCVRTHMPNFLMWIGEDPWLRTEIGLAGHYLERPPRFVLPTAANLPYRTKRSASIQERSRKGTYVRISKSVGCVKQKVGAIL